MVAKITTPASILRALNYNEKKVQKGKAECIYAGNFLLDAKDLNFYDKLYRFKDLIALNTRAKTNTLHVSLNFDPTEKLSVELIREISSVYMQNIGFGKQPYLVYQHYDAGHPHIHIITTTIQENGKRINTYNIGRNQSEKARKEIEESYHLIRASGKDRWQKDNPKPIAPQKIKYGVSETKKSITDVLQSVLYQYKYTSLPELNAVLQLYNVVADRGNPEGRIYRNHGLNYRILDEIGNKIGVPIKASSISFKPTLKFLEEKFKENEQLRTPNTCRLKTAIDWVLAKRPGTLTGFISQLKKEGVTATIRQNEQGFIYGITFIDHRTKSVFNGSDLGKNYTASALQQRIQKTGRESTSISPNLLEKRRTHAIQPKGGNQEFDLSPEGSKSPNKSVDQEHAGLKNILEVLMRKERMEPRLPFEFFKKKRKRRKPNL